MQSTRVARRRSQGLEEPSRQTAANPEWGSGFNNLPSTNTASTIGEALQGLQSLRRGTFTAFNVAASTACNQKQSTPVQHFLQQPAQQTPNQPVFLACGSTVPAVCFRLSIKPAGNSHRMSRKALLAQAGDIESNPGPVRTPARRRSGRPTARSRRPDPVKCDECGGPIHKHQLPKALQCNQPECTERSHKLCKASTISRWNSNPVWTCRLHRGEQPSGSDLPTNEPAPTAKVRCLNCNKILAKPIQPATWLRCKKCGKGCHKKVECCAMLRDERLAKQHNWTCPKCVKGSIPQVDQPLPNLDSPTEDAFSGMKVFEKQSLRILQWNANGIKSKSDELAQRFDDLEIDVALIQETKLGEKDKQSSYEIKGYKAFREDRKVDIKGGGVLTYIRGTLPHELVDYRYINGCEIQTIRIRLSNQKWITLTNFYCPPENSPSQEVSLELNSIPVCASSLICGDFNVHSPI